MAQDGSRGQGHTMALEGPAAAALRLRGGGTTTSSSSAYSLPLKIPLPSFYFTVETGGRERRGRCPGGAASV